MTYRIITTIFTSLLVTFGSASERAAGAPSAFQDEAAASEKVTLADAEVAQFREMRCQGRFEEALAALEEHAALATGDVRATALKGLILFDLGRIDDANALVHPYRLGPCSDPDMVLLLGYDHLNRDSVPRALAKFELAALYRKGFLEAELNKLRCAALLSGTMEDINAVLAQADQANRLPAGLFQKVAAEICHAAAARRMTDNQVDDELLSLLDLARQHDPENTDILLSTADALIRLGRFDQATDTLDNLAKEFPERMESIQLLRAGCLDLRGMREQALEAAIDSITISGRRNIGALELACRIEFELDRLDDMRLHMDRLNELSGSVEARRLTSMYFVVRAKQAREAGDEQRWRSHLSSAYEACRFLHAMDPFHIENLERLLWICEQLGDRSELKPAEVQERLDTALRRQKILQEQRQKKQQKKQAGG